MIKVKHLTSQYASATNISHSYGMKTEFVENALTPESAKSAIRDQMKLDMVNSFLDFNLISLCHTLYCAKYCESFAFHSVHQEMYPDKPALQCKMKITFSYDKSRITVRIFRRNGMNSICNHSKCTSKEVAKLLEVILYLEDIYCDL